MNARDEFYKVLGDDLTLYGNKSVLYQYLDKEQEKRAAAGDRRDLGKARSYQLRIRFYRNKLRAGELSPEEYWKLLLEVLIQKPKFGKRYGKPEKTLESKKVIGYTSRDPQPLLRGMTDIALGEEKTEKKTGIAQNVKKVYDILSAAQGEVYRDITERMAKRGFWQPPYAKLMELTDAVLDVAVAYDIREFFFGTAVERQEGYSAVKRRREGEGEGSSSRAERTDKSLKLIDDYCRKKGKTLFGSGQTAGAEPRDMACDALYRKLLESGNEEVFVPLLVDGATGCGIYLLGRAYFEESCGAPGRRRAIEDSCAYGVMFLDNDYGEGIRTGYHINNEFGEFPDYNSARFKGDRSYEKARQEAEDTIREINGKAPDDVPEEFRKYFETDTEAEEEELREEIKRELAGRERELRYAQQ